MTPMTDPAREEVGVRLYDKTGREIMVGDVVKVDHFIHYLRRRRCFMHKQVIGVRESKSGGSAFELSHLDLSQDRYYEARDGRVLSHYEIVQGAHDDFYDRPRTPTPTNGGTDAAS